MPKEEAAENHERQKLRSNLRHGNDRHASHERSVGLCVLDRVSAFVRRDSKRRD